MRTKDRPVLLRRAVNSVMRQSWKHWRLVIVNTGDRSAVEQALASLDASADVRIRVLHLDNGSSAEEAANAALGCLHDVEYIAIHDDDDSWAPDFLGICLRQLQTLSETYPATVGVITMAKRITEEMDGKVVRVKATELLRPHVSSGFISLNAMLTEDQFNNIQFLFKRNAISQARFNSEFGCISDWDFHLRILATGDIYVIPQVLAFSHVRERVRGPYANRSIAARSIQGRAIEQTIVANAWLRADLSSGTVGLGTLNSIRPLLEHISWLSTQNAAQSSHANVLQPTLDRLSGEIGALKAEQIGKLDYIAGKLSSRPVKNAIRLAYHFAFSGRRLHYACQFAKELNRGGLRHAINRTKTWLVFQR
ncbi:glycosyltransferase family A protein [Burkholderia multivorans]|uniref:glycosyltransferase family A protein n=1 Tax=Burkholderia multivorans TaxID=87883 RepID=UPI0015E3D543|nr:glycosyltransferase family A protein [Burkholderia multivorans]